MIGDSIVMQIQERKLGKKFKQNVIIGSFPVAKHGDIILNKNNNSVFLLQKSIEIGKSLISSAPRKFE